MKSRAGSGKEAGIVAKVLGNLTSVSDPRTMEECGQQTTHYLQGTF